MSANDDVEVDKEFEATVICGLHNLGNTCYFNTGIQCLFNVASFVTALRCSNQFHTKKMLESFRLLRRGSSINKYLWFQTQKLADVMQFGQDPATSPSALLEKLIEAHESFAGYTQQDCQEMLNVLLSRLDDESKVSLEIREVLESLRHSPPPACASSLRQLRVLMQMEEINIENAQKHQLVEERKGREAKVTPYRAPTLYRSSLLDPFRGYYVSEVTCGSCDSRSKIVEEFSMLSISIPSMAQRVARAKTLGQMKHQARKPPQGCWGRFIAVIVSCLSCIYDWFSEESVDYPLTLEECLDVHFSDDELHGSNQYTCEVCGKVTNAKRRHFILQSPEELVIHIKRFHFGRYWASKRKENIIFPIRVPNSTSPSTVDLNQYCRDSTIPKNSTTYELHAVANHRGGSVYSGHYTAFCHKVKRWLYFNDQSYAGVKAEVVADSEEYILFYRRTACEPLPEEHLQLRRIAREYLLPTFPLQRQAEGEMSIRRTPTEDFCYVSRMWLHRVASFVEPGPLLNQMCYCAPERRNDTLHLGNLVSEDVFPKDNSARHFHSPAGWFYVPILRSDFNRLISYFGGGPLVSTKDYAEMELKEHRWCAALLAADSAR